MACVPFLRGQAETEHDHPDRGLWIFVNSHWEPHDADCGPHQTVGHVSHMCVCLKYMGV